MVSTSSPNDDTQLMQTIEMFEVITQSQPQDYQSLEILKEAYIKLNREEDVINTSRRIAQAYVQLGQLSSAILEYEGVLQRYPDDPAVLAALGEIENKANSLNQQAPETPTAKAGLRNKASTTHDDGREPMRKLFVDNKVISSGDFDLCWTVPPPNLGGKVVDPFIQVLADKGTVPIDNSLKLLCENTRLAFLPMEKYDVDIELVRTVRADLCQRYCVLPFDRMSKSVMIATANPFNRDALQALEASFPSGRILFYLAPPQDIIKALKKIFR